VLQAIVYAEQSVAWTTIMVDTHIHARTKQQDNVWFVVASCGIDWHMPLFVGFNLNI
jgi:hypothetical protein